MEDLGGWGGSGYPLGVSLGSELGPFAARLPAHSGPLCAHSCPAVPAFPHMGFFTGLCAEVREEELMTAVSRRSGPKFWCGQMGL